MTKRSLTKRALPNAVKPYALIQFYFYLVPSITFVIFGIFLLDLITLRHPGLSFLTICVMYS